MVDKNCLYCKKSFQVPNWYKDKIDKWKCCSHLCAGLLQRDKENSREQIIENKTQ